MIGLRPNQGVPLAWASITVFEASHSLQPALQVNATVRGLAEATRWTTDGLRWSPAHAT